MQDGITGDRPRSPASEPFPEQVLFTLDQHDFVAYWMFLWDRGSNRSLNKVEHHMSRVVLVCVRGLAVLCAVIAALGFGMFGFFMAEVLDGGPPGLFFVLGLMGLIGCFILPALAGRAQVDGGLTRGGYLRQRAELARTLEEEGEVINRARIHWLILQQAGLTLVAELYRGSRGAGRPDYRETWASWDELKEVVVGEQHLFLLMTDDKGWIRPRQTWTTTSAWPWSAPSCGSTRRGDPSSSAAGRW